jgi:hypothetical protein
MERAPLTRRENSSQAVPQPVHLGANKLLRAVHLINAAIAAGQAAEIVWIAADQ